MSGSKRRFLTAVVAAAALVASACGPSSGSANTGTVSIVNEMGGPWSCSFNPFSGSVEFLAMGTVYEPLVFIDGLTGKQTPWLASAYAWSPDNLQLTFTIRQGVKWSDGQPLTAADVVYTFKLLQKNATLDLQGVWSVLSDVSEQPGGKVLMTFQQPAVPNFYNIADQVPIVPQHLWSQQSDPVKFENSQPVGSGPFLLSKCTPQNITYVKNPNYWQPGMPKVSRVVYPAFDSNDAANAYLASGKGNWGGQFIPNIDSYYVKKAPADNHYWFPPTVSVWLFLNQTSEVLKSKAVRQALSFAIDRERVSKVGEYGYEPPESQTGVVTPTFKDWLDPTAESEFGYKFDPAKAQALLEQAGYKKNASGVYEMGGKPLSLNVINISDYTDWVASLQVIKDGMKQVGIQLNVQNLSANDYQTKLYSGDFDLAYGTEGTSGSPNPYYELRAVLYSSNSAPIGQTAASNYERYMSKSTDTLLDSFAATTDPGKQKQILNQVQHLMVEEVPSIPVVGAASWDEYSTKDFSGWPTESDPYANPSPSTFPDWGVVLLRLQPK